MMRKLVGLTIGIAVVVAGAEVRAQNCTETKLRGTGQKFAAKLSCHSKAASKGLAVDPQCLTKAEDRFDSRFAAAEGRPPCLATGDAPTIEALVDAFVDGVLPTLRPSQTRSICAGLKLKAVGRKALKKLNKCHGGAAFRGAPVLPECLSTTEAQYIDGFAKAEAKGDCLTTGDAGALEATIDDFVDAVVPMLRPVLVECSGTKTGEAGLKADKKLTCHGKAAKDGVTVDADCLIKAETNFTDGFATAESFGDCLTVGDEAAIEAKVDAFVDDIEAELRPATTASQCANLKLSRTGNKVRQELICRGNGLRDGLPVSVDCTAEVDLSGGFANAENKDDCLTTGDLAAIEAKVGTFVNDVVGELQLP